MNTFYKTCLLVSSLTHIPEQVIRFGVIGCLNTAFAYTVFASFIFIGLHYTLATLLSTIIGTFFSFKTFGTLVFDNPDNRLVFKFIVLYGFCYFLSITIQYLLVQYVCSNKYINGFISMLLVAAVSFCLNKWLVFRKKTSAEENFVS